MTLIAFSDSGIVKAVKIYNNPNCCEICKKRAEKFNGLSIKEMLKKEPLPFEYCKNDFCNCNYKPIFN